MQKVIPKEALKQSYLYLVAGQDLPRDSLLEHLVQWGFQNVPLVEERGDFSVRGGIVDLFSPGYGRPIAPRIRRRPLGVDPRVQSGDAAYRAQLQEEMLLLPMKEFSLKRAGMDERAPALGSARFGVGSGPAREKNSLLESIRCGHPVSRHGISCCLILPGRLVPVIFLSAGRDARSGSMARTGSKPRRTFWPAMLGSATERAKEEHRLVAPVDAFI